MHPMRAFRTGVLNLTAGGFSLIALVPIYLLFVNALKTQPEASSMGVELPALPQWANFGTVIDQGKLVTAFFNSMLYSLGGTAIAVLVSALAAYSQIGMILLYAATQIPFSVFLIYAFVDTLPRELDEAALIDGCSPVRTFVSVVLPILTPVLVTSGILSLLNIWNEFLMPLYFLNSTSRWPMTLAVYNFFGRFESDWSLVSADIVLTVLPVILIYIVAQRWILSGVSAGAVKG